MRTERSFLFSFAGEFLTRKMLGKAKAERDGKCGTLNQIKVNVGLLNFNLFSLPSATDPTIKDHVRKYLTTNHQQTRDISYSNSSSPASPILTNSINKGHRISSSDSSAACRKSRIPVNHARVASSAPQSPQSVKPRYQSHIPTANGVSPVVQKKQQPRFEAYMMTGDLILNLSRTPQSSGLLPAQAKKVDSLRDSPIRSLKRKNGTAPKAIYDSSPSESSSPSLSDIAAHAENVESNNNNNRKNSKLSKMITSGDGRLNSISSSLDEEEEQLIDDSGDHGSSSNEIERNKKFNLINSSGCANNTSSSSSNGSSPTNSSSNSSPNGENYDGGGSDNDKSSKKSQKYSVLQNEEHQQKQQQIKEQRKHLNVTPSASMSSTTTTSSASTTINRSETLLTPTPDVSHSVPTSPTSLSTPLLDAAAAKRRELASSVPTSPECLQQDVVRRSSQQTNGICVRKNDASGFRTSRSEDHLQHSQRDNAMGNAIPIDIDEDVNSSLNTLLDTRNDSEDSQVRGGLGCSGGLTFNLFLFDRAPIAIESCGPTTLPSLNLPTIPIKSSSPQHRTPAPSAPHLNTQTAPPRRHPCQAQ
jgi:PH and SEC7 domain-containing protein